MAIAATALPNTAHAAPRSASIAIDGHTGRVLYSRNADRPRYPASLTKIMTLYLLFEFLDQGKVGLNTKFVVTPNASKQPPSKIGFKPGQTIRVHDAIRALVTKSANDVAAVVAENLGGTVTNFARLMTDKARQIGMSKTTFKNASGLPNSKQLTTARDMATLGRRIQSDFPQYYKYFRTKYFSYKGKRYKNHNKLLFSYKGTDGIKTGYTRASGFNLTASVRRGQRHVIAVVMGGKSGKARNAQMATLLNRNMRKAVARSTIRAIPLPTRNPETRLAAAQSFQVASIASAIAAQPAEAAPKPMITATASAPVTVPTRTAGSRPEPMRLATPPPDTHQVQVGAYASKNLASKRIEKVREAAGSVLRGRKALTIPFRKKSAQLYRARFAGFTDRASAKRACNALQKRRINCVVMRAE